MRAGRKTIPSQRILVGWMMTFCAAGLLTATAQQPQEEETTRQLWDTAFINAGEQAGSGQESRQAELLNCDSSGARHGSVGRHSDWRHALAVAPNPAGGYGRKDHHPRRPGIG